MSPLTHSYDRVVLLIAAGGLSFLVGFTAALFTVDPVPWLLTGLIGMVGCFGWGGVITWQELKKR